jgi:hypothetical protein
MQHTAAAQKVHEKTEVEVVTTTYGGFGLGASSP